MFVGGSQVGCNLYPIKSTPVSFFYALCLANNELVNILTENTAYELAKTTECVTD